MNWDIGIDEYTVLYIKQINNENLLYNTAVLCGDLNVKEKKKGGAHMVDLLCFTAETDTAV